jgi:hypothetical protein
VKVPDAVAALFAEPVSVGAAAQAFPFLTIDDAGAPHCCLLSATEIEVAPDDKGLHLALAARRTRAHLAARGRATLLAAEGTTLHSLKLDVTSSVEHEGVLAVALALVDHRADSLGIELTPLSFMPPPEIAQLERWDLTAAALDLIRDRAR